MARDLKVIKDPLTGQRRLSIANGNLETVSGIEECAQRIETALKMVLGEWAFDLKKGLPIFDQIFKKQQHQALVLSYYREALINISGVKVIQELTLEKGRERNYKLRFRVLYEEGFVISGEI